jgi:hypothetical protein
MKKAAVENLVKDSLYEQTNLLSVSTTPVRQMNRAESWKHVCQILIDAGDTKHFSTETLSSKKLISFCKNKKPAGFRKRCSYLVAKSLLASAKCPEIFRRLGNNVAPKK